MASSEKPPSSLLTQAEQIVAANPEGVRAGVIVDGKAVGAEISAKLDPGKKSGFQFGAVMRVTKGKDTFAAIYGTWTGQ